MKAKEVIDMLKITRAMLSKYVSSGEIKVTESETGRYDYDEDSVYMKAGLIEKPRSVVVYTCVHENKQIAEKKLDILNMYTNDGDNIERIYDYVGGADDSNDGFRNLIQRVCTHQVKKIITDGFNARYGAKRSQIYSLYKMIFEMFNCELCEVDLSDKPELLEDEKYDVIELTKMIKDYVKSSRDGRSGDGSNGGDDGDGSNERLRNLINIVIMLLENAIK